VAGKAYASKQKLAKTGVFLSENLTKKKRDLLSAARERFENKNV